MSFGSPKMPAVPAPTPVPQVNDPAMIDLSREAALKAQQQDGFEASLLTPGASNSKASAQTQKTVLGYGAVS